MQFDQQDGMMGLTDQGKKKRGTTFLKMFRFDKARTPRHSNGNDESNQSSAVDQSQDYANYLLEIVEGK